MVWKLLAGRWRRTRTDLSAEGWSAGAGSAGVPPCLMAEAVEGLTRPLVGLDWTATRAGAAGEGELEGEEGSVFVGAAAVARRWSSIRTSAEGSRFRRLPSPVSSASEPEGLEGAELAAEAGRRELTERLPLRLAVAEDRLAS